MKKKSFLIPVAIFSVIIFSLFGEDKAAPMFNGVVQNYEIVDEDEISFLGRDRYRISITAPEALSRADRAATAAKAALDYQLENSADLVMVWLEMDAAFSGKGHQLAIVTYIPDGCGNSGEECGGDKWEARASDYQISHNEIYIMKAWYENISKFRIDGLVDEPRLKEYISKKLKVDRSEIVIPSYGVVGLEKMSV